MIVTIDKNSKITENFKLKEFVCKDGTLKTSDLTIELFERLQILRDIIGAITITSGYRSPDYNKKIGGSPKSNHMKGEAVDIRWFNKNWTIEQVSDIAHGLGFRVLVYNWGLHLDCNDPIIIEMEDLK